MDTRKYSILILLALLLCGVDSFGQNSAPQKHEVTETMSRRKSINPRNGLYTRKHNYTGRGLQLSLNAIYYYGDVDMLDQAFVHGWQQQNLSLGGSLKFDYLHQIANTCNLRMSVSGGYLQGNDSARTVLNEAGQEEHIGKGWFKNGFGEVSLGVEWYPFPKAGFYIYAGLGFSLNFINYNFPNLDPPAEGDDHKTKITVVPVLPVEIGYNFDLTHGWLITISASVHQALMDTPNANLDAFPVRKSPRFQWGDGYFTLGLSFSYRWQHCAPCRLNAW